MNKLGLISNCYIEATDTEIRHLSSYLLVTSTDSVQALRSCSVYNLVPISQETIYDTVNLVMK